MLTYILIIIQILFKSVLTNKICLKYVRFFVISNHFLSSEVRLVKLDI